MKRKILAATYGGGHVNIVLPVARAIMKEKDISMKSLALTLASNKFSQENLPFLTIKDYEHLFSDIMYEVEQYGAKLAARWHNPSSGLDIRDSILYLGLSMWDLVQKLGEKKAEEELSLHGRSAFLPTTIAERILLYEKPDLVLTTTSPRMEKALLIKAIEMRISTIQIEDLFGLSPLNLQPPITTKTVVANDYAKENLIKRNIPRNTIEVLGSPAFDQLFVNNPLYSNLRKKLLGEKQEYKLVFWASDGLKECPDILRDILKALDKMHEYFLLIKMHPNEIDDIYSPIVEQFSCLNRVKLVNDVPSYELIKISDIVVTQVSTVGYEAVLLDKPLVVASTEISERAFCYSNLGVALKAYCVEDYIQFFNQIISNSDVSKKLSLCRKRFQHKGNSTRAIVQLIKQMLK